VGVTATMTPLQAQQQQQQQRSWLLHLSVLLGGIEVVSVALPDTRMPTSDFQISVRTSHERTLAQVLLHSWIDSFMYVYMYMYIYIYLL
jgi:hypothetical protein